jgi:hypothetical protein
VDIIASGDVKGMQSGDFALGFPRLLLRPWFYRTWIVQEFVLAKFPPKFVCGTKTTTCGQFVAAYYLLGTLATVTRKPRLILSSMGPLSEDMLKILCTSNHPLLLLLNLRCAAIAVRGHFNCRALAETLGFYVKSQVTDSRDKVFGTLGLLRKRIHHFFKLDNKSTVAQTYTGAMTYIFNYELVGHGESAFRLFLSYTSRLSFDRTARWTALMGS